MTETSETKALADAIKIIKEELFKDLFNEADMNLSRAHTQRTLAERIRKNQVSSLRTGLIEILRDLPHMKSLAEQRRIFALVEQETGLRMVDFIDRDSARLKAILARGRIRGEADYRLVRSHVDVLEGDPGQAAALEEAYRLIGEFETRLTKTPRR
jgi:hypothetical protein